MVAILFQIVYRVLGHAIDNHFKVQMGAGAIASIAGQGNQLTTGNGCANADFVSRQMGISCFYAIAMIDYNAISGQLTILNGKQQIICQRNNPKIDLFKKFGVNEEDAQYIRVLLHQTSVQNKEISVQIKATVENKSQMYKMKLHTLWSPMKKDVCIGIIGYFDIIK